MAVSARLRMPQTGEKIAGIADAGVAGFYGRIRTTRPWHAACRSERLG